MEREKSLEEQATELLEDDAKKKHTTLYRMGILDERRQSMISRREMPMSKWSKDKEM
jgi:hypothetical protein